MNCSWLLHCKPWLDLRSPLTFLLQSIETGLGNNNTIANRGFVHNFILLCKKLIFLCPDFFLSLVFFKNNLFSAAKNLFLLAQSHSGRKCKFRTNHLLDLAWNTIKLHVLGLAHSSRINFQFKLFTQSLGFNWRWTLERVNKKDNYMLYSATQS